MRMNLRDQIYDKLINVFQSRAEVKTQFTDECGKIQIEYSKVFCQNFKSCRVARIMVVFNPGKVTTVDVLNMLSWRFFVLNEQDKWS